MTLPFSFEQFIEVFAIYNHAIWPAQILTYLAGALLILLVVVRSRHAGTAAAVVLPAMWLLNGVGYHLFYFSEINPAAIAFGGLFVLQAVLIAWVGLVMRRLEFDVRADAAGFVGAAAVAYALVAYPLLGWSLGHVYPGSPVFGVAPCPTTIFTLGILLLARPAVPAWLFVIPLIWSAIGGSAAGLLGIREDFGLIVAAIAALAVLLLSRRVESSRGERVVGEST